MYVWVLVVVPFDCTWNIDNWQFLSFDVELCAYAFGLWHVFRSCNHDDSKHSTLRLTRQCDIGVFLCNYITINHIASYFWMVCE